MPGCSIDRESKPPFSLPESFTVIPISPHSSPCLWRTGIIWGPIPHLLYCDWNKRDSLLVTREEFETDLENNYLAMRLFGVKKEDAPYFLPPFEWYNDSIGAWTSGMGLQLVNYTSGTLSHADYTLPGTPQYRNSQEILDSITKYESSDPQGLNGFILLSHIGSAVERTDKFYLHLEKLIISLEQKGYEFKRIDQLL